MTLRRGNKGKSHHQTHLLDWWWRLESLLDLGWWSRDGGSAVAAEEEKLRGAAVLPFRVKNKGRNLQGAMPPQQHLQESRTGSTPLKAPKHSHCSDKGLSRGVGQRVSSPGFWGSRALALGWLAV